MNKKIIISLILALVLVFAVGCSTSTPTEEPAEPAADKPAITEITPEAAEAIKAQAAAQGEQEESPFPYSPGEDEMEIAFPMLFSLEGMEAESTNLEFKNLTMFIDETMAVKDEEQSSENTIVFTGVPETVAAEMKITITSELLSEQPTVVEGNLDATLNNSVVAFVDKPDIELGTFFSTMIDSGYTPSVLYTSPESLDVVYYFSDGENVYHIVFAMATDGIQQEEEMFMINTIGSIIVDYVE